MEGNLPRSYRVSFTRVSRKPGSADERGYSTDRILQTKDHIEVQCDALGYCSAGWNPHIYRRCLKTLAVQRYIATMLSSGAYLATQPIQCDLWEAQKKLQKLRSERRCQTQLFFARSFTMTEMQAILPFKFACSVALSTSCAPTRPVRKHNRSKYRLTI